MTLEFAVRNAEVLAYFQSAYRCFVSTDTTQKLDVTVHLIKLVDAGIFANLRQDLLSVLGDKMINDEDNNL